MIYKLTIYEKIRLILMDIAIIGIFAYLFYESFIAFFILLPGIFILYKRQIKVKQEDRKNKIRCEFKDVCIAMSSNLAAGYSLENSLKNSVAELDDMTNEKSYIGDELKKIINKVSIGKPVETAFYEFAEITDIEEILVFSEILSLAKRSSGNIIGVMKKTTEGICEKIEQKRQIEMIFASKKYEQRIMSVVPFFIIIYVKISSPGLLNIMYMTLIGRVVMSVCLIIFVAALMLSEKIMEIKV